MQWSTKTRATVSLVLTSASLNWVFWKSRTRLAERLALLDVVQGLFQAALGGGDALDGDIQTLLGQLLHQLDEALALDAADDVLGRNLHVIEEEFGGVVALHADLVEVATALEALGSVGFDDDQATCPWRPAVGSVLATTMMKLASWPLVMKVLEPLTT